MKENGYDIDTCSLIGLTDSASYTLFTSAGFTLAEGRHITAGSAGKKSALISRALAEENNLRVGDSISVTGSYIDKQISGDPGTLTLK